MNEISHETRQLKSESYDRERALERWINEMCEVYEAPREEIEQLAIVQAEKSAIENLKSAEELANKYAEIDEAITNLEKAIIEAFRPVVVAICEVTQRCIDAIKPISEAIGKYYKAMPNNERKRLGIPMRRRGRK